MGGGGVRTRTRGAHPISTVANPAKSMVVSLTIDFGESIFPPLRDDVFVIFRVPTNKYTVFGKKRDDYDRCGAEPPQSAHTTNSWPPDDREGRNSLFASELEIGRRHRTMTRPTVRPFAPSTHATYNPAARLLHVIAISLVSGPGTP